jgi:Flp pilus assembly protein TadD
MDSSIVNPVRLPLDRRMDVCEQCHVHTSVAVLRETRTAFDFAPARQLEAQYAYFKNGGDIDLVSHADRLKQSACFRGSMASDKPLECATCHNPHAAPATRATRNQPCRSCHTGSAFTSAFTTVASKQSHTPASDCVSCHMPVVKERTVPHGTFSDHWIRVPSRASARAVQSAAALVPYYARDRSGPESALYLAMGKVVFASLSARGDLFDEAATELTPLLADHRASSQGHFLLGLAHQARGRQKEAAAALARAMELGDTRPEVLRALAQAKLRQGDTDAARALYERALASQPALAWMRAEYADVLQQEGALSDAVREYRAALREQPSLAAASFNLGLALLAQQQLAPASAALLDAVRLEPAYASALEALLVVKTSGRKVTQLSALPSPVSAVRTAPRQSMMFGVRANAPAQVAFMNTPPNGYVLVYSPDGALLLAVPTNAGGTVTWDVRSGEGRVLAPGLYRAQVQARGMAGALPTQWFGIVAAL